MFSIQVTMAITDNGLWLYRTSYSKESEQARSMLSMAIPEVEILGCELERIWYVGAGG